MEAVREMHRRPFGLGAWASCACLFQSYSLDMDLGAAFPPLLQLVAVLVQLGFDIVSSLLAARLLNCLDQVQA